MTQETQGIRVVGFRVDGPPGHVSVEVGVEEAATAIAYAENYGMPLQVIFDDGSKRVYVRQE